MTLSIDVRGFTLIELAIVLFVVSLLLGGMLTPLGRHIAERQSAETRRALEEARTALVGYALARRELRGVGHLPCPDMRDAGPEGIANDGLEDRLPDGRCARRFGNLPWATLALAPGDAWGNHLSYAVAPAWAARRAEPPGTAPEWPEVCLDTVCARTMRVAALLLSHGANGLGARNIADRANAAPTAPAELANASGGERFMLLPPRAADRPGGEFDDLLLPLSADWLRGRLCDGTAAC